MVILLVSSSNGIPVTGDWNMMLCIHCKLKRQYFSFSELRLMDERRIRAMLVYYKAEGQPDNSM